jgi:hypothetical protein
MSIEMRSCNITSTYLAVRRVRHLLTSLDRGSSRIGMSSTRSIPSNATVNKARLTIVTSSELTVVLHELCNGCQAFSRSWDVLDAVQDASSILHGPTGKPVLLCSIVHLMRCGKECHLCTFLLASLKGFPNKDFESKRGDDVYLRAVQGDDGIVVQVYLGTGAPVEGEDRRPATAFLLRTFQCEWSSLLQHRYR